MNAEIVAIGTEMLMGELVDTNSSYIASELAKLGIELRWVSLVGDDPDRLYEVINRAWRRSDVTLTSGGLGPTSDDLTRETIATVLGEEMSVRDDLLEHLKGLFARQGVRMPEANLKQATLIASAETIPNPLGTAPGWWAEKEDRVIAAMPGPPRELERMWKLEVAPKLKSRNKNVAIVTRTLKTFGISEGGLNEMIAPLFESTNPEMGIYSKPDGIHLRAIATGPTEAEARALIEPVEAQIRATVGEAIWGEEDDTPESLAATLLAQRGATLGVMESFTGGLLSSSLADMPASSTFLKGGIVVSSDDSLLLHGVDAGLIREYSPVSPQVAEAMASAACERFNSNVGVAVTSVSTGSPGPGERAGACHVGFAIDGRTSSATGYYATRGLRIRSRAVTHALLGLVQALKT